MSCYKPIKAYRTPSGVVFAERERHDVVGDIEIPCGMCIGCRMRKASDWTLRCMHEAQGWESNCFVTLTYGVGCLPPNGSLEHRDYQLFMKRLRLWNWTQRGAAAESRVRFFMCGEYGDVGGRPHYHACLFNVSFDDRVVCGKSASGAQMYQSATLDKLWGHGKAVVQDLVKETASYCARYIMKKQLGEEAKSAYSFEDENGKKYERKPVYAAMSLKPGIGALWWDRNGGSDSTRHDFVVADGARHQVPRYYDKLLKRVDKEKLKDLQSGRVERAPHARENTEARRRVKEVVHEARLSTLKRTL